MTQTNKTLQERLVEMGHIGKAASILSWDMEVMMPPHAAAERGQVMATLSAIGHDKATDPALGDLIAEARAQATDQWQMRNAQLLDEDYKLATQIPSDLVFALSEAQSACVTAWQNAKPTSDWAAVKPLLEKSFALVRERAGIFGEVLGCDPYDAQLRLFARGNSQAVIDPLFAALKRDLPPLVREIAAHQAGQPEHDFALDVSKQKKVTRKLVQRLGYSFKRGRLDASAHPFSGGTGNDSRITTRYTRDDPFSSMHGSIHEVGHALYTQNLPAAWADNPVGGDSDLSLHESQSLIFERHAGLSDGFLHYLHRLIVAEKSDFSIRFPAANFIGHLRRVRPSFIRIDADEATYPLHVVLRYEMEQALFSGAITVADIPDMWNAKIKEYLGLDVPEHRLGCMQDIHWYWNLFGYFPTYTQGALYAAQLFDAMTRDIPDIEADLAQGKFKRFRNWLTEHIHQYGQLYDAPELIARAAHAPPDAVYFLNHLRSRYLG